MPAQSVSLQGAAAPLAGPACEPMIAAARSLIPLLASESSEAEQQRRITLPSLHAIREAGLLRLGTPVAWGGHGASVRMVTEVCIELARGCAASSWIVGIAYGGCLFAGQLDDRIRRILWAENPDAIVCGTANPSGIVTRTTRGFTIEGTWSWMSGVHHADWALLGIQWTDEMSGPRRGMALVSTRELKVIDTWRVAGMRGTGSDTVATNGLHVADEWVVSLDAMADGEYRSRHPDEPRVTFHLSINLPLVGTCVGIAVSVLETVIAAAIGGKRAASPLYTSLAEAPAHQINVARAAVMIDTARLHLARAADEVDAHARAGGRPDKSSRARLRMDASHAVHCSRDAVSLLLDTGGAGSFADGTVLQRAWRDLETASRHAAFSLQTSSEIYGRVLLGRSLPTGPVL
ncbi:acyl-CoA dehydrogenase family protein [Lentzea roselyniae]|uniref:Acyl-CoA dehydrogenase family protein n=2 Tax=Lentzea roselyniae TaxID=531940 RepID=A0ABP7CI07_9PSEU